jgi:predicted nucleotidyltransferase
MEDIKNKLTEENYLFLKKLQDYIGIELLFMGSIKRYDFLHKYSDIDIVIISDNIEDTIVKLQNFLNLPKRKIKLLYQKIPENDNIVYGYKTNYNDFDNNLRLEIILYDEKYRKIMVQYVKTTSNLPFFITYLLFIIKKMYYELNLLSSEFFTNIKYFIIKNYLKFYHNQQVYDDFITIKK